MPSTKHITWLFPYEKGIPLQFITAMETLSQEFRKGCPWENLYAVDLVIITESLDELQEKLILCKTNMEGMGLRVNMGKIKVLISGPGLDLLPKPGKDICGVCLKDVGTNPISSGGCSSWVNKKCRGICGSLKPNSSFRCKWCTR